MRVALAALVLLVACGSKKPEGDVAKGAIRIGKVDDDARLAAWRAERPVLEGAACRLTCGRDGVIHVRVQRLDGLAARRGLPASHDYR